MYGYATMPQRLLTHSLAILATIVVMQTNPAFAASSSVTIDNVVPLPDFSASSINAPATLGVNGSGSATSSGSVNGQITGEAPVIAPDVGEDPAYMLEAKSVETQTLTPPAEILRDLSVLPEPVRRMHDLLHEAALSGDANALRMPIEMNEMPPILGLEEITQDPIEQIRQMSGDYSGVEALAIMSEILEAGFVHIGQGTPQEMYVWPYFAHYPIANLNSAQRVELFRIITSGDFEEMDAVGQYVFFRLGIGPDGTWHYFVAGE